MRTGRTEMMNRSNRLRASDYAALLRLAGELADLPHDPHVRRRHAGGELCRLLGASHGLFLHTPPPAPKPRLLDPVLIGYDDAPQDLLRDYFSGRLPMDPCAVPMHQDGPPGTFVALRRQLVDDRDWYASDHVNTIRKDLGQDDAVYARLVSPAGETFGQCFLRPRGDRPFTERQRQILHAFSSSAAGLYLLDTPTAGTALFARLAPRHRPVAERLLAGDSVKEAARRLGLSRHTVVEYAKAIHKAYGVSSRAELLVALFRERNGQ